MAWPSCAFRQVLGITKSEEHEGIDRHDTLLPGAQSDFAQQVLAAAKGKPVVLVLVSGGILSIDELVQPAPAIVDSFNPAQQGPKAIAHTLFGAPPPSPSSPLPPERAPPAT